MSNGLPIWISTMSISIISSLIMLTVQDAKKRRSLNGHSLDGFNLWVEKLQSEVDFIERLEEYREAVITITMILFAYVKGLRPQQLKVINI